MDRLHNASHSSPNPSQSLHSAAGQRETRETLSTPNHTSHSEPKGDQEDRPPCPEEGLYILSEWYDPRMPVQSIRDEFRAIAKGLRGAWFRAGLLEPLAAQSASKGKGIGGRAARAMATAGREKIASSSSGSVVPP